VEKEGSGFWHTHFGGLAFVMEEHRAFSPNDKGFLYGAELVFD
jgi:hypothetical protein